MKKIKTGTICLSRKKISFLRIDPYKVGVMYNKKIFCEYTPKGLKLLPAETAFKYSHIFPLRLSKHDEIMVRQNIENLFNDKNGFYILADGLTFLSSVFELTDIKIPQNYKQLLEQFNGKTNGINI